MTTNGVTALILDRQPQLVRPRSQRVLAGAIGACRPPNICGGRPPSPRRAPRRTRMPPSAHRTLLIAATKADAGAASCWPFEARTNLYRSGRGDSRLTGRGHDDACPVGNAHCGAVREDQRDTGRPDPLCGRRPERRDTGRSLGTARDQVRRGRTDGRLPGEQDPGQRDRRLRLAVVGAQDNRALVQDVTHQVTSNAPSFTDTVGPMSLTDAPWPLLNSIPSGCADTVPGTSSQQPDQIG